MVVEPIEESYFKWLCAKVIDTTVSNYWDLLKILHTTEFVWQVVGDRNRSADGLELRETFLREKFRQTDDEWFDEPCGLLEMIIAFCNRASFQTDMPIAEWFWVFMTNLHLEEYRRVGASDVDVIDNILHNFVWRTYQADGYGGLFPLRKAKNDQREVELWYQFYQYVDDQGILQD